MWHTERHQKIRTDRLSCDNDGNLRWIFFFYSILLRCEGDKLEYKKKTTTIFAFWLFCFVSPLSMTWVFFSGDVNQKTKRWMSYFNIIFDSLSAAAMWIKSQIHLKPKTNECRQHGGLTSVPLTVDVCLHTTTTTDYCYLSLGFVAEVEIRRRDSSVDETNNK